MMEEDLPFGGPPEEYSYRCSNCSYEEKVNEAIIDVEMYQAEFEENVAEDFMPVLGCPGCNKRTMEFMRG